ncbi:MAG: US12 family protein [Planctomycetes bacterium]|nr:US12 family protein [Planctomycetota bacterium]
MSYRDYQYDAEVEPYSGVSPAARGAFIAQTYLHLFGAILLFVLIQVAIFQSGAAESILRTLMRSSIAWLVVIGAFMLVGTIASSVALTARSKGAQYLALLAFVAMEAVIFVPLIYIANKLTPGGGMIQSAAVVTLGGFALLTGIVFLTRADFSFLRGILMWAGVCALLLIIGSIIFNFSLGLVFSVAMVALAGGFVLYDTSNVLHHYSEDRYVAAALALFASVAMMFWYVLRIFMQSRD